MTGVQTCALPIWPARYKDDNARHNADLSAQLQLFLSEVVRAEDISHLNKLNLQVVVFPPTMGQSQAEPACIYIRVPHEDNKGEHLVIDIDELVASFARAEPDVESVDKAWPKLRKQMRQVEAERNTKKNE